VTANAWYQQGVRILDVRDPAAIQQVGYWVPEASEVWAASWVPARDAEGRVIVDETTGAVSHTNLLYTTDAVRGVDILRVDLPEASREHTPAVVAPVLDSWFRSGSTLDVAGRATAFGAICLLPRAATASWPSAGLPRGPS
jgi:hypothetical protein